MSFGFTRKPSPAQERRNKIRRLVNLTIHEVSSVDRGAGQGCHVLLTKRETEKHKPCGGLGAIETEEGRKQAMSDFDTAIAEQRYAQKMFPNEKSVGAALAKWYATPQGKDVSRSFSQDIYQRQQLKAAGKYESAHVGDHVAWAGAVQGGVGYSGRVGNDFTGPSAASDDGVPNAGSAVAASKSHPALITADNIAKLQKIDPSLTWDAAVTMLGRGGR